MVAGFAGSLIKFRGPLLKAMRAAGCEIFATAAEDDRAVTDALSSLGIGYQPTVTLRRAGLNPFGDRAYLADLKAILAQHRPDVVFAYTHKAVIYSSLAVRSITSRPRVFPLITGLGYGFIGTNLRARVAGFVLRALYRRASRSFSGVIFQNPDDRALFQKLRLVRPDTPQCIVRGSGIDLEQFGYSPLPSGYLSSDEEYGAAPGDRSAQTIHPISNNSQSITALRAPRFLLIARLLGDKGIREYVAAAREIRRLHPSAEFHLIGPTDPNPAAIPLAEVEGWQREGLVRYHGLQRDVPTFMRDCTVYVLPSYREGTPRTVLEAMATGRAVITTDTPGCRETIFDAGPPDAYGVRQGRNGFLVPVKSVGALASAMGRFLTERGLAATMGAEGRKLAQEHYDVNKVNSQMLRFMQIVEVLDVAKTTDQK